MGGNSLKPLLERSVLKPNIANFNETFYIRSEHKDKDSYKKNAFNLDASDNLPVDRHIPDSRHVWSVQP